MKTTLESIFFDVREYNAKIERSQRRIKANDEAITASMTFSVANVPTRFLTLEGTPDPIACRVYTSKGGAQQGLQNDRVAVKFKIGAACKWFDKHGHPTQRPDNADLDAKHYEAILDYNRKDKNPNNPLAPSGYWVNAIMFVERQENPFAGMEIEPLAAITHAQQDAAMPADMQPAENAAVDSEDGGLPF